MAEIRLNSEPHTISDGATVADLLRDLSRDPKKLAVEVNGAVVPRGDHAATVLRAGDRVEIVTLVGGG
jgi:sulfur carrier protein